MKSVIIFLFASLINLKLSIGQHYKPQIVPFPKMVKADARLILKTGYLEVPENQSKPNGPKVKIPFFFVRRPDQDARKNISLYTTGGPGYSTTANIDSISYNSGFLKFGGFIAFDQRGTKRAQPCLDCAEVNQAIKDSYKYDLDKDSLVLVAVKKCHNRFTGRGIDLSAYNTIESAEDINDLRLALNIDSLNLVGISYSGGLMLTVARNHPEAVRSLILNSPLPGFVNYEEQAMFNINEALEQVFSDCEADSINKTAYKGLRVKFHQFFAGITGKKFSINYLEKGTKDSIKVTYTKNELLDAVINRLNARQVRTIPAVIVDILNGRNAKYVREILDEKFDGDNSISMGMRYSVYCTEQIAYSNTELEGKQDEVVPWLAGYSFNNVNKAICDCWKVTPETPVAKTPVYSKVPALLVAGDIDPWCRPYYNTVIKRCMPNSQLLIIHNGGHAPGYTVDGIDYLGQFITSPLNKLIPQSKNVKVE